MRPLQKENTMLFPICLNCQDTTPGIQLDLFQAKQLPFCSTKCEREFKKLSLEEQVNWIHDYRRTIRELCITCD